MSIIIICWAAVQEEIKLLYWGNRINFYTYTHDGNLK